MTKTVRLFLLTSAVSTLLVGCQSPVNPAWQQYRYGKSEEHSMCLLTTPAEAQGVALRVRAALAEKGFQVLEVNEQQAQSCPRLVRFDAQMGDWAGSRIRSATLTYTRRFNGQEKSSSVQSESQPATFGAPLDDEIIMIRKLVDRIFPQPIAWQE